MNDQLFPDDAPAIEAAAVVSTNGLYRYRLTRRWGDRPAAAFIMLNPSTADATTDDATVRRCLGFARRFGCDAIEIVNLFAWRATDPDMLLAAWYDGVDVIGPDADTHIVDVARAVADDDGHLIAAWGAGPAGKFRAFMADRIDHVLGLVGDVACLTTTQAGQPRHPLYLPANAPLTPWSPT